MESNKKTIPGNYAGLIEQAISVQNLSYSEIKGKYANYPLCLLNYIENGIEEKFIEIRFDNDEVTLSCSFDVGDTCGFVYLLVDRNKQFEDIIRYLKKNCRYDFVKKRWTVLRYYIKVKERKYAGDTMGLFFFKL